MPLDPGTLVRHPVLGRGHVLTDLGGSVVVKFDSGLQQCAPGDLRVFLAPEARVERGAWDSPLPVFLRAQSLAIQSTNATWGVFSRSRITLLPHQLWVCRKVLERWPIRWLVADDVGLGKTIEAGLLLSSLMGSGRVRRLLILTPASLVEQWQERLRVMFDIRLTRYVPEADTPKADFWNSTQQVVASAETVRRDKGGRWERMLQAEPWDLVMVDEAHHLNHDEQTGATLAFQLVDALKQENRLRSAVFFTGTPHRGKTFGFLSLLRLLRDDVFDPRQPLGPQLARVGEVMIRNNKQRVTTMGGDPLFKPVAVAWEMHSHSPAEAEFYAKLTEYIATGRAYASGLASSEQRTAILILITMQKLASSSVAAVRRALEQRLSRLRRAITPEGLNELRVALKELQALDNEPYNADRRARLEEQVAELAGAMTLGPREIPALEDLVQAANAVAEETKISRLVDLIESRFVGESVLLFTEYKATQALVMSALMCRYGDQCVTFINGDEMIEGVLRSDRSLVRIAKRRVDAADEFNSGRVRFLVSTEAAGEGVDLQHHCSALIHVDLPWNPMRLHQRVGRVHRFGQTKAVRVVALYNPETVEGRIWECLREKLERITEAFRGAMDDPEDMLQAVLGMSSGASFEGLFAGAPSRSAAGLRAWFDEKSATFGGQDAVSLVKDMFGSAARFDFAASRADLPQLDLRDLAPFVKAALVHGGRRPETQGDVVSVITPEPWRERDPLLSDRYEGLRFSREAATTAEARQIAGVGHKLVDVALAVTEQLEESVALAPGLEEPVVVLAVRDEFTDQKAPVERLAFGVAGRGPTLRILRDWELVRLLNEPLERPLALKGGKTEEAPDTARSALDHLGAAVAWFSGQLAGLDTPYRRPCAEVVALLWPANA